MQSTLCFVLCAIITMLHKGLCIVIYLHDILVLICSKQAGKRAHLFLCSLLVRLGLHINFSKLDLHLSQSFTFWGLCWDTVCMSVSLPPDKLADIQQLALSLLWPPHVTVRKVMSFLGKANFCINGHSNCSDYVVLFRVTCYVFTILPHICFLVFIFLLHLYVNWTDWLNCNKVQFPLQFPLPDVVIATDATPTHWAFYFQGSGLPFSVSGTWSGSLSRAHITLQELQAVAVMLCRMAFCLSGKVVALHLDNSTAKAYLSNQGGTVSPFLSRLACWILSLIRVAPSTSSGSGSFLPLGPSRGGPPGIFSFYSMPALFHFGNSTASGGLGVECLQPSLEISGKLHVSSSSSGPSCSGQVSSRTCQRSTQTFISGGSMLDGGSLASHSSQHAGRHSLRVSHRKRSRHGCLGRPGAQGSAVSAINPLAAQQCVLHQQGFSSSVCQAVAGTT